MHRQGCSFFDTCTKGKSNLHLRITRVWHLLTIAGLECDRLASVPRCVDVDECTGFPYITMMMVVMIMIIVMNQDYKRHHSDARDWASGIPYCGHNASCLNSVMDLVDIKYNWFWHDVHMRRSAVLVARAIRGTRTSKGTRAALTSTSASFQRGWVLSSAENLFKFSSQRVRVISSCFRLTSG